MKLEKRQIFEELDRINASDEFRGKPLMMKLLSYLVTESVEGRSDQIKGFSIGVDLFGKGVDFDPGRGALVRNNAVRLRGLLKTYYLGAGKEDPIFIDIPKGRYVPQFRINNTDGDGASSSKAVAARGSRDAKRPSRPAIAVLPLRNLSNDPALDFLATGFANSLSEALTKFDDLRVFGAAGMDDSETSIDELRHKGIDFFVDGAIQAIDSKAKVSFRLTNTADGCQLWGDSIRFDVERDDLFDVEERITGRIASLVGGEYGQVNQFRFRALTQSRANTVDEQAILLRHYHYVTVLTEEAMAELGAALQAALEKDPDSALINAIAGGFYGNVWAFAGIGADEALSEFARLTEKAYTLNPNHQLVIGTLAFKCFVFDERDRLFGLFEVHENSLASSPLRLGAWAMYISLLGEWERGKKLLDRVFEYNVRVPAWLYGVSFLYHYRRRDYEAALDEANKYRLPGLFWGPAYRAAVLGQLGRLADAEAEFDALLECRPDFLENGRRLMGCFVKEASLLEHLVEGMGKIGVQLA